MAIDPRTLDLGQLFRDPGMFAHRDAWRAAGFDVADRADPHKVMVGSHPSVPGYLFKKYSRDSSKEERENFPRRIEGAQKVRELIAKRGLRGVVAPEKWLHELPRAIAQRSRSPHVLIVEKLPLKDSEETKRSYEDISEGTLRDLCVVLHAYKGLDSIAKNLPFTTEGRIAFIDTEHWDRHLDREHVKLHVGSYLSSKRRKFAEKTLEQLADG